MEVLFKFYGTLCLNITKKFHLMVSFIKYDIR